MASAAARYIPSSLNEIQAGTELESAKMSRVSFDPDAVEGGGENPENPDQSPPPERSEKKERKKSAKSGKSGGSGFAAALSGSGKVDEPDNDNPDNFPRKPPLSAEKADVDPLGFGVADVALALVFLIRIFRLTQTSIQLNNPFLLDNKLKSKITTNREQKSGNCYCDNTTACLNLPESSACPF